MKTKMIKAKFLKICDMFSGLDPEDFSRREKVKIIRAAAAYVGLSESALVKSITSKRDLNKYPSAEIEAALYSARRCYHAQFGR